MVEFRRGPADEPASTQEGRGGAPDRARRVDRDPGSKPRRARKGGRAEKARPVRSRRRLADALGRLRTLGVRVWTATEPYRATVRPWVARGRDVLSTVSGLGWLLLAAAAVSIFLGARLGWREFTYLGATFLVAFVIACLFALGRAHLAVELEVSPPRVVQGDAAAARVLVSNEGKAALLPIGLEFRVGEQAARFTLPTLGAGTTFDDMVVIPTSRRGVIPVGPVVTQRGDPFGTVRREVVWTRQDELFVHPVTVALDALGAGLLRDLEGRTTQDISMSDLAFHTLRDYVPGDDRRYIHWRSSAKVAGFSGEDRFLVRQFLDTRRSHIGVVTDVATASYKTASEFELALSIGASIAVRALADEMDLTIVCGEHVATQPPPHTALDTYSRAELDGWSLARATGQLARLAPDVSVVVLVTGSRTAFAEFQHARGYLNREVATAAVVADEGGQVSLRDAAGISVVTLGSLAELPRVMAGGQVA